MINVQNKVCEHDGCTKRPHFNTLGKRAGRFCAVHKVDGMVDVKNKVCEL
jgi:hypothetical protein